MFFFYPEANSRDVYCFLFLGCCQKYYTAIQDVTTYSRCLPEMLQDILRGICKFKYIFIFFHNKTCLAAICNNFLYNFDPLKQVDDIHELLDDVRNKSKPCHQKNRNSSQTKTIEMLAKTIKAQLLIGRGFIGYPKGRNRDVKLVN